MMELDKAIQIEKNIVYFVGAGTGKIKHLTLEAYAVLSQARVVLYDLRLNVEVLSLLPTDCKKIFVGKQKGFHSVSQDKINSLLVGYAKQEKGPIVRLKGGDPMLFSRLGEEIDALRANRIRYRIVPGLSSYQIAFARLNIPMTERGLADKLVLLTGHSQSGHVPDYAYKDLLDGKTTFVFFMALSSLESVVAHMLHEGANPNMQALLIEKAGWEEERWIQSHLDQISLKAREAGIEAPALLIVGNVLEHVEEMP